MKTKFLLTIIFILVATMGYSQFKALMKAAGGESAEYLELRDEYFSGRPEVASAEVESFKENHPAKKETLNEKMKRFKSEGFQVAVILDIRKSIKTVPPMDDESKVTRHNMMLEGSLPNLTNDELKGLIESYVDKMNEEFSTDIFEAVDIKTIPFRQLKNKRVDDWEVTKYRMVVTIQLTTEFYYTYEVEKKKPVDFHGFLSAGIRAPAHEYVNEKKGVKKEKILRPAALGGFATETYKPEGNPKITQLAELQALINAPLGSDLGLKLKENFDAYSDKYIELIKKKAK